MFRVLGEVLDDRCFADVALTRLAVHVQSVDSNTWLKMLPFSSRHCSRCGTRFALTCIAESLQSFNCSVWRAVRIRKVLHQAPRCGAARVAQTAFHLRCEVLARQACDESSDLRQRASRHDRH